MLIFVFRGLSSQCQSALLNTSISSSAACLNPSGLISLVVTNSATSSVIPGVTTWISGLCSQAACSNATLQTIVTDLISGCSTDLSSLGVDTTNSTAIVTSIQAAYPTVRQLMCLNESVWQLLFPFPLSNQFCSTSTNTLCVPELLTNIQSATTTLSLDNIVSLVTKLVSGQSTGIPSSAVCTNCTKAAYTVLSQGLPGVASTAQSSFSSECGANYTGNFYTILFRQCAHVLWQMVRCLLVFRRPHQAIPRQRLLAVLLRFLLVVSRWVLLPLRLFQLPLQSLLKSRNGLVIFGL